MKKNKQLIAKKVAFCFSGQARTLDLCYPYIKKNLLDPVGKNEKDYDVFCCAEDDADLKKITLLKPIKTKKVKSSEVDKIIKDELRSLNKQNYKTSIFPESFRFNLRNTYQQLYKINQSFELLERYMKEKNITYKYFIRIRFDFLPLDILRLKDFETKEDEVIVPSFKGVNLKNEFIDLFCITKNFDTFKSYCSLYQNFKETVQKKLLIKPTFFQKLYLFFEKNYRSLFLFLFKELNKKQRKLPRQILGFFLLFPNMFYKEFKAKNRYYTEKVFFYYLKSEKIIIIEKKISFVIVRNLTDGLLIFGKE